MSDEINLPRKVRPIAPHLPVLIRTVNEAIDMIQALPDRAGSPWAHVEHLLFIAAETGSNSDLQTAYIALTKALREKGWLRE